MIPQILLLLLAAVTGYFMLRLLLNSRPAVSAEEAAAALEAGTAVLVDVREPGEWRKGVAAPAALLPWSDLRGSRAAWRPFLEKHRGKRLLLYCHSGIRSGMAAALLNSEGYDAANIGGYRAWCDRGLPTRRP